MCFFPGWLIFNMQQLPYLSKIYSQYLFRNLINYSPNDSLHLWVRNIHSSLVNKCRVEEKSLNFYDDGKSNSEDCRELHTPVMVKEVVDFLAPKQGQVSWNFCGIMYIYIF